MLYLDLIHLVGLDDLNVGHGIGQRFPQVCQRNGIAHRQTVDVPKIIRAFPTSVSGNDAVGAIATDGRGCVSQHRRACGKVTFVGDDDILYDDADAFLDCIREELPYRDTTGFRYEVLTDDPTVRKAVKDILFDFFDVEEPCEEEDYTQTMGGI